MIIAVDFDGILVEDKFPDIGLERKETTRLIKQVIERGHEVILWTCRVNERLKEAIAWCEEREIRFCAVNNNSPQNQIDYPTNSRKVYADVYIDDHNLEFTNDSATYSREYAIMQVNKTLRRILKCQEEN